MLERAAGLGLALASILGYYAVGAEFYDGYWVPQGYGMDYVVVQELGHAALFVVFGLVTTAGLVLALRGLTLTTEDLDRLTRVAGRGSVVVLATAGLLLATLTIGQRVLGHAVITDDEHVYRFIAQTLRTGHLTAPSPGTDLDFFREQFVVLTEHVRYGKYPIGHPVMLALGQAVGLETLVVPLATALVAVVLFALGARIAGRPVAAFGVALYALSPQVLLTGATLLSQPLSALCLVVGLWCLLAAENAPHSAPWLAGAGLAFGYGLLVRPLPGALFIVVAAGYVALSPGPVSEARHALRARLARLATLGAPVALAAGVFLVVNRLQTGSWGHAGYDAADAGGRGMGAMIGAHQVSLYAMSLVGHLLRLDLWLLGWPLSLVFCLFAPWTRRRALLWAIVGAAWAYRILVPKSGVAITGPLYLFEVVPLLCLLTADGLVRLVTSGRLGAPRLAAARRAISLVLAGMLVNLALFLPVKLTNLHRAGEAQLTLPRLVEAMGLHHALVFYDLALPQPLALSWAYFARPNSPNLDDDVLYARFLRSRQGPGRNVEFWRRRYPDRTAWFFGYAGRTPRLVPLETFLRTAPEPSP